MNWLVLLLVAAAACAEDFNSNGVKIHYTVTGKGEPVILIHGLLSSARMNWDLPGITSALAKHYQVVALDNRGHGQSDKPEADDQYGVKMVEDVVRLMDHLHLAKAHVVGYSMGGMMTMKLLTLHPDRVTSAVLGGMGWLKTDSPLQNFWGQHNSHSAPAACMRSFAKLAVTEAEVKAIRVPVTIIVGGLDPCRRMYVQPLRKIRPDWPEQVIFAAGHLDCVMRTDFKKQIELALAGAPRVADAKKQIVFVHGKASHGYGGHSYGPAFRMLARMLNENAPAVNATVITDEQDLAPLDKADAIMLGSDGGRLVKQLGDRLEPLMKKGVGLGCIHYTVDPTDPKAINRLIEWIGGSYAQHWSVNPHWEADFKSFPDHPVARGLKPFKIADEWYYHMKFVEGMTGVTPILSAVPPEKTRQGKDGPHSGNPHVRARTGMAEVVGWVYERPTGGRGFGFTGMHTHWNWAQDSFRKSVLNALVWIAGVEVPAGGVPSKTPTLEELEADLGQPRPANFNADAIRKQIEQMNR